MNVSIQRISMHKIKHSPATNHIKLFIPYRNRSLGIEVIRDPLWLDYHLNDNVFFVITEYGWLHKEQVVDIYSTINVHINALKSPEQRNHKKHYTWPPREIITSENKSVYNLVRYKMELVMLPELYSLKRLSAIMLMYNSESIIPTFSYTCEHKHSNE